MTKHKIAIVKDLTDELERQKDYEAGLITLSEWLGPHPNQEAANALAKLRKKTKGRKWLRQTFSHAFSLMAGRTLFVNPIK